MVGVARIGAERSGKTKIARPGTSKAAAGSAARPLERMFAICPTDPSQEYKPVRRSIRLHGHSTTLQLEHAFWGVLEELAAKQGDTLAQLITRIHDHCVGTDQKNLASCLRVVCLKYIETCR
jgi:predicted DNA-binding ribbon-helix-helix protein